MVTISGKVSSPDVAAKILELAKSATPKVTSLMQIPTIPVSEILLQVKFAEVDRTALSQYGINILSLPGAKNIFATSTAAIWASFAGYEHNDYGVFNDDHFVVSAGRLYRKRPAQCFPLSSGHRLGGHHSSASAKKHTGDIGRTKRAHGFGKGRCISGRRPISVSGCAVHRRHRRRTDGSRFSSRNLASA